MREKGESSTEPGLSPDLVGEWGRNDTKGQHRRLSAFICGYELLSAGSMSSVVKLPRAGMRFGFQALSLVESRQSIGGVGEGDPRIPVQPE